MEARVDEAAKSLPDPFGSRESGQSEEGFNLGARNGSQENQVEVRMPGLQPRGLGHPAEAGGVDPQGFTWRRPGRMELRTKANQIVGTCDELGAFGVRDYGTPRWGPQLRIRGPWHWVGNADPRKIPTREAMNNNIEADAMLIKMHAALSWATRPDFLLSQRILFF